MALDVAVDVETTLVGALLLVPPVMGGAGLGYSDAETLLLKALREIRFASSIMRGVDYCANCWIVTRNFRLALSGAGRSLARQGTAAASVGNTQQPVDQLGLRAEAAARAA